MVIFWYSNYLVFVAKPPVYLGSSPPPCLFRALSKSYLRGWVLGFSPQCGLLNKTLSLNFCVVYFFLLMVHQEEKTVCTKAQTGKGAGCSEGGDWRQHDVEAFWCCMWGRREQRAWGTSRFPARPLPLIVVVVTGLDTKSCPTLVTPRTGARQAPLSVGFPREGYWSGLPFASPGDLPNPGIKPSSFVLQTDSLHSEPLGKSCGHRQEIWCGGTG